MKENNSILNQKTGALYIRVSTDKQEELSPDAQIRLGMDYARQNHIFIPNEFIFRDDGISGRQAKKRPNFQKLIGLAKSQEHPIDAIIVWKFSRFARNQEESIVYKSLLKKNNVDVISISEPLVDGPFGTLIERIIEWMDEYYSIRLSGEVLRGMTENALRGNYQGEPPIGYISAGSGKPPLKDSKTLAIVESCDKWLMESRLTTRQIALKLNSLGCRTKRGNPFDARGVEYILTNPFYAGKVRWNYTERGRRLKPSEEVIYSEGSWEALWTWEHFLEIQTRLKELSLANAGRTRKKRDVSACQHWLSGVLICSSCGRTLANTGTGTGKGFQCWGYVKGMCTESHFITFAPLEKSIIHGLEHFLVSDYLEYTIERSTPFGSETQLAELHQLLSRLDVREKRVKDAYLNEVDTLEEYKENRKLIVQERERIQSEITALSAVSIEAENINYDELMLKNIADVLKVLKDEEADYAAKGNALRSIVDRIIFDRKNTSFDFYLKLVI